MQNDMHGLSPRHVLQSRMCLGDMYEIGTYYFYTSEAGPNSRKESIRLWPTYWKY